MAPEVLGHLEIWLVTGSQEMYGEATLRQVEAQATDARDAQKTHKRCLSRASWRLRMFSKMSALQRR